MGKNPFESAYVEDIVSPKKSRNQLAAEHSSLRQSSPGSTEALGHLRTRRGNTMDTAEFTGGADSITPGGFSHPGEVGLRLFDADGQAGQRRGGYNGQPAGAAGLPRPDYHTARDSASPCDEGCGSGAHVDSDFLSDAISRGSVSPNVRNDIRNDVTSNAVASKHAFLDAIREQARRNGY